MTSPNAKYGPLARGIRRDLSEKGWVPARYWVMWWWALGVAMVVFYVVLTPIWLGLRAARGSPSFARAFADARGGAAASDNPLRVPPSRRAEECLHLAPRAEACDSVTARARAGSADVGGTRCGARRQREGPGRARRCERTRGCRSTAPRAASAGAKSASRAVAAIPVAAGRARRPCPPRSSTRSPSFIRYEPSITHASPATIGSTRRRSSAASSSVHPACQWIASSSTNGTPSRAASSRPKVVFPHPLAVAMIATRRTSANS